MHTIRGFGAPAGYHGKWFSAEYLHGDYDDNNRNGDGNIEDSRDAVTLQLAVEF